MTLFHFTKNTRGFTFVEIMLVVIIIGILAGIAVPRLVKRLDEAKKSTAKTEVNGSLAQVLDLYELDAGTFPTTDQGLKALIEKPTSSPEPQAWKGPYLKKKKIPKDPWGKEYIYTCPGEHSNDYDLSSAGPDGVAGNADDITNWETET
jgi:general secretion pathway protein G